MAGNTASGMVARLVASFTSALMADFEVLFGELRLELGLVPSFESGLTQDLGFDSADRAVATD